MTNLARPRIRLLIALVGVGILGLLAWLVTGSFIPEDATEALLFQNALLLVVFGSALLEQKHTTPAEAFVNATMALVTLIPVYRSADSAPWWLIISYLLALLVAAGVCIVGQSGSRGSEPVASHTRALFRFVTTLGRARIVFSVVFLGSVAFFVESPSTLTLSLVAFWAIFMAIWPLGLPQLLEQLKPRARESREVIGVIDRVDSPGLVRVVLTVGDRWRWNLSDPVLVHLSESTRWGLPVFSEERPDGRFGTVLLAGAEVPPELWLRPGVIERPPASTKVPTAQALLRTSTGIANPELLGVVRERSTVSSIQFEALPDAQLEVGHVVVTCTTNGLVHYQVMHAITSEELFPGLHYGSHIVEAQQIGLLDESGVFRRYPWLPPINSPVFRAPSEELPPIDGVVDSRVFILGDVSGTTRPLTGRFVERLDSHTAILGVTGSGKTELAFDIIRHAVDEGVKVMCIDLTAQYADRLDDLAPRDLSITDELAKELGAKLFDVETGSYGAGNEKKALEGFATRIRVEVSERTRAFLAEEGGQLGMIELRAISNTKATLWITEIFLTALLEIARSGDLDGQKVLVVVEEAHTVMPETSSMGLGDFDSKGTVAKIAQIALQGRKYGVGLLILAQRTATVSKSVLTQCNTVISFSCIDDTSINFLRNVFGSSVAEALPSLPRLRAVAHGDWINSDAPVTFEIPFDDAKAERRTWRPTRNEPAVADPETVEPPSDPPF